MKLHSLNEIKTPVSPSTLDEWRIIRKDVIENLHFSSSIDLLKHTAPLNPHVFGAVEYSDFVVEKVIFQSLPQGSNTLHSIRKRLRRSAICS